MPGPSRRSAQRGGPSDRRAGAHRPRRTSATPTRRLARRVSWSRRIGFAAALLLVLGGAIAFASQAVDTDVGGRRAPGATAPPPPPLTLIAPREPVTRADSIDLLAVRPIGLRGDQAYRVLVYVNRERVLDRLLPSDEEFSLERIPLAEGENVISAALQGSGGVGKESTPLAVIRDTTAPVIRVTRPEPGAPIYAPTTTISGRTEDGAELWITASGSDTPLETSTADDGRFEAAVELGVGRNAFVLRSRDAAGNESTERLVIERSESAASIRLSVTPGEVETGELPLTLKLVALVRDERGREAQDVSVTFTVSPPHQPTITHRTVATAGTARWEGVDVPAGETSVGTWLVTVHAELPSGIELRDDESVSVLEPVALRAQ